MNLSSITTLLPPLQSAIAMASWEDAQAIASEIARLCRLEAQRIEDRGLRIEAPKTAAQEQIKPSAYGKRFAQEQAVPAPTPVAIQTEGFSTAVGPESGPCIRITLDTRYDEQGHEETWRNDLAYSLNVLLINALGCGGLVLSKHTLAVVSRVAEFEQIKQFILIP